MLGAWEHQLGWSKTEAAGAFIIALLLSAFLAPIVGEQIDRGRRRILFPTATLITAVLLGSLSFVTIWHLFCLGELARVGGQPLRALLCNFNSPHGETGIASNSAGHASRWICRNYCLSSRSRSHGKNWLERCCFGICLLGISIAFVVYRWWRISRDEK